MFDDMYQYWNLTEYPSDDYEELLRCRRKWEDDDGDNNTTIISVESAIEAQWWGFYDLYSSNGTITNTSNDYWSNTVQAWYETYSDFFGSGNRTYLVMQRCNYVSNLAYYRSARAICDYDDDEWFSPIEFRRAAKNAMLTVAFGSHLFHASETYVGLSYDIIPSAALAYLIYQYTLQSFTNPSNLSPIMWTMEDDPDSVNSSVTVLDEITNFALNYNTSEWGVMLNETFPGRDQDRYRAYAINVALVFTMTLPWRIAKFLIEILAPAIMPEPEFVLDTYLPELQAFAASEDLPIPLRDGIPLLRKVLGFLVGFAWAFIWQEESFTGGFYGGFGIIKEYGPRLSTFFNRLGESIHGFDQTDPAFLGEEDSYPAAEYCNEYSSHAFWHQESAATYHNFVFVGDSMSRILTNWKQSK